jgi:hypothetical protein
VPQLSNENKSHPDGRESVAVGADGVLLSKPNRGVSIPKQGSVDWAVPKTVKPSLPPQARGVPMGVQHAQFSRRRGDELDIYLAKQRHERRLAALLQFQLPPL